MRSLCAILAILAFSQSTVAGDQKEKPIFVLDAGGHTSPVRRVIFTPDGQELISVSDDKTIRIWDVRTGESIRVLRPFIGKHSVGMLFSAALSPDGLLLAVGGLCPVTRDG